MAILTASDRCCSGATRDESGPAAAAFCAHQGWDVVHTAILPDDTQVMADSICHCADHLQADLVLTCGGTGLGPRDVTPEATLQVIHRAVPGIAEAMRSESFKKTPFAMLSRGIAGMRNGSLVINLPGSPRAVRECLEILLPVLPHALAVAGGAGHEDNRAE